MASAYRHLKRISVIQALFEWEFYDENPDKAKEGLEMGYQETFNFAIGKEKEIAGEQHHEKSYTPDPWTEGLLEGVIKNIEHIREIVQSYAPEWPLPKIAPADRVILYLGTYELMFVEGEEKTPGIVVINEAVEMAKTYGGGTSSKFVNGVLNSIYKKETDEGKQSEKPAK